jgi:hypothetical protein
MMRPKKVQDETESPVVGLGTDGLFEIARLLRDMYGEIVDQGVPDRHAQLISELAKRLDDSSQTDGRHHQLDDSNHEDK